MTCDQCGNEFIYRRSTQSHNHYFAALHQAWLNLPENISERFPTETHLRKYALIKTNYCHTKCFTALTSEDARRLCQFIKMVADEYAEVQVSGNLVTVLTAKSQSVKAMGKEEFQKSKTEVLDFVASMIDVSNAELQGAAT